MNLHTSNAEAQTRKLGWTWLVIALAWALAITATLTHQTYFLDHHALLETGQLPWIGSLAVFLLSWQVMTVAMMLPSSLPMLYIVMRMMRGNPQARATIAAFLAGYAAIWTLFAVTAFAGDTLIHALVERWSWLAAHSGLIGAATFALAGAFQFSSLKERCLSQCRNAYSFFLRYYRRNTHWAWQLGLQHGIFCLGCCWALMLIMFGVGVGSLAWMALLTGVMVIEKAVPGGQRLSPFVGVGLLLLSVVTALGSL